MKSILHVQDAYLETDRYLRQELGRAADPTAGSQWREKIELNNQAYFVMLFAQLEGHINAQFGKLVLKRQASRNWRQRWFWKRFDPSQIQKTPFMDRVLMLTNPHPLRGRNVYSEVNKLYEVRCTIAHGGTRTGLNIPVEATRMYELARRLRGW